jgi:hypothetical protein
MVEICMFGSAVFEVIALSMFHVYENKVTVNGCKFCTLRRMLILKPRRVIHNDVVGCVCSLKILLSTIYFMLLHLTAFKM